MKLSGLAGRLRHATGHVEESPHSTGHDAGEIPGGGNLSDRATETNRSASGQSKGEKVV